jgi:hypothetical protein
VLDASDDLRVVHGIPGRIRLRLPRGTPGAGLTETLAGHRGIQVSAWSPRTRSLLVLFEPGEVTSEEVVDVVARHAGRPAPPADRATLPTVASRGMLSHAVVEAVGGLDGEVKRVTRGTVGLAALLPLGLAAWAVLELLRGRTAPLAWSSALWYAHGLFRDYQMPAAPAADAIVRP